MSWILLLWFSVAPMFAHEQHGGPDTKTGIVNVKELGARGDGVTLETAILQRAIDSCAVSGGEVLVPPGTYLTGSLDLRSNVTLRLLRGAVILGSKNLSDYKERQPRIRSYNDYFLKYSVFYAERASNITITGEGVIDGQGKWFKVAGKEKPIRYMNRPFLLRFAECSNVRVENIRLQNSAMWTQHYFACENVTIRGISVYNHANKNNDMIDIDGCRNVIISDCFGDTDDDGITLKSTSERITENVVITNCVLSSHCNAIKAGTESTGGFRNISISNMVVKPSSADSVMTGRRGGISGITLSIVDGGVLDGVTISGVTIDGPEVPIFLRLGNRGRLHYDQAPKPAVGRMRDVSISNITARNVGRTGCSITGLPGHALENVTLSNIRITFGGGVSEQPAATPAEMEDSYPESTMWGNLPAYGFFVRHASGVKFRDCVFSLAGEDVRPAFVIEDADGVSIDGLRVAAGGGNEAVIVLSETRTCSISQVFPEGPVNMFVKLQGVVSSGISITNSDLRKVKTVVGPAGKSAGVLLSGNLR